MKIRCEKKDSQTCVRCQRAKVDCVERGAMPSHKDTNPPMPPIPPPTAPPTSATPTKRKHSATVSTSSDASPKSQCALNRLIESGQISEAECARLFEAFRLRVYPENAIMQPQEFPSFKSQYPTLTLAFIAVSAQNSEWASLLAREVLDEIFSLIRHGRVSAELIFSIFSYNTWLFTMGDDSLESPLIQTAYLSSNMAQCARLLDLKTKGKDKLASRAIVLQFVACANFGSNSDDLLPTRWNKMYERHLLVLLESHEPEDERIVQYSRQARVLKKVSELIHRSEGMSLEKHAEEVKQLNIEIQELPSSYEVMKFSVPTLQLDLHQNYVRCFVREKASCSKELLFSLTTAVTAAHEILDLTLQTGSHLANKPLFVLLKPMQALIGLVKLRGAGAVLGITLDVELEAYARRVRQVFDDTAKLSPAARSMLEFLQQVEQYIERPPLAESATKGTGLMNVMSQEEESWESLMQEFFDNDFLLHG